MQLGDIVYSLEGACREIERLSGHVKALKIANDGFKATERSETDVYHMALQDMSSQLQHAAAERAACQTKMLHLQECVSALSRPTAASSRPSTQWAGSRAVKPTA
jgi:hypothetical protein